jgi:purine-binding chemotaxis protein CheW
MDGANVKGPITCLTFTLGGESFGVDVMQVKEVLDIAPITRVPRGSPHMRGVINLRGMVIPVMDLAGKLGMRVGGEDGNPCIIVVEMMQHGERAAAGVMADAVLEVVEIPSDQVEPAPAIGMRLDRKFIRGLAKRENGLLVLLDLDRIFSPDETAFADPRGET